MPIYTDKRNGRLRIYRVSSDSIHPRVFPGDLLLVEETDAELPDKAMLLFKYDGKYLMRQKKTIEHHIRRSGIHAVDGTTHSRTITVLGRLIGWLSGPMALIITVV